MKKTNLDEMQEQKLMELEHNTCWLAFWLLVAAIVAQMLINKSMEVTWGETAVLLILCGYLSIGCLRLGIWDRSGKFSTKRNIVYSLIAGAAAGLVILVRSLVLYGFHGFLASAAVFLFPFVCTFVLTFGVLCLCGVFYRRRKEKLEQE